MNLTILVKTQSQHTVKYSIEITDIKHSTEITDIKQSTIINKILTCSMHVFHFLCTILSIYNSVQFI